MPKKVSFKEEGFKKANTGFGTTIEFKEEGASVIGTYLKVKPGTGKYGSNIYMLLTDEEIIAVWGCFQIDQAFEEIPIGSVVSITYLNTTKIPDSKNEIKNYNIMYKEREKDHAETEYASIKYEEGKAGQKIPI